MVPGLGHFYLGENKKGVAYLIGIGGLEFFGLDLDLSIIGALIGVPLEVGGGTLWVFSIVDAYRTARRMESGHALAGDRPCGSGVHRHGISDHGVLEEFCDGLLGRRRREHGQLEKSTRVTSVIRNARFFQIIMLLGLDEGTPVSVVAAPEPLQVRALCAPSV